MEDLKLHQIENQIFTIRDMQVMFDFHLADFYGTETKRLNEQVKRNAKRFPHEFMFQLTENEWKELRSQIETTKKKYTFAVANCDLKKKVTPVRFLRAGSSNALNVRIFSNSHDKFIIIDDSELCHLGASLRDLGKKWFAFSRMDSLLFQVLNQLLTH